MQFGAYIHMKPHVGAPHQTAIFYVGKGNKKRAGVVLSKHWRNKYHQNIVHKYGPEQISVGYIECSTEQNAFDLEVGIIKCLKRSGVVLTNQTRGGEGTQGWHHSAETRAKISASLTGRKTPDSVVRAMSIRMMGVKQDKRACTANMSAWQVGRVMSAEARAKMAAAKLGIKQSLEHRAKVSKAKIGVPKSAETRARMSAAQKLRRANKESPTQLGDKHE